MIWSGRSVLLFILLIACFAGLGQSENHSSIFNLDLIPKPRHIDLQKGQIDMIGRYAITKDPWSSQSGILFIDFVKKHQLAPAQKEHIIAIELSLDEKIKNDEAYEMQIMKDKILIQAKSEIGISRGFETLKQLILLNKKEGQCYLPMLKIEDSPQFQHRGLLLDCSRHFFPVEVVKKYIDLLAVYKMNTLHWHLTEDQGWRIAIDRYPELTQIAAYRIEKDGSTYGGYYSKADVKEIVDYATQRHINIIPEIELPGHSQAAIAAYPHLSCTGDSVAVANDWGVFKEIYCAGNDSVFAFLENVLTEVIALFPSPYIHIGGDEAPKFRWEHCEKCQQRIAAENLKDEHELQSYFIKRIERFITAHGKQLIGWDEILEGGLAEGAIVQSWRGMSGGIQAVKGGHRAIMSPTSHAYFDYDLKAIDLKKVYSFYPIPEGLNEAESKLILGGECNMWTEHVPDEQTLDRKVFPRLLAMSEVLWSDSTARDFKEFTKRLQSHYSILDQYSVAYGEESVPFSYHTIFKNDSLFLVLQAASNDLKLYYQKTCSACRSEVREYHKPILIDSNVVLVQAYKNGKEYGEIVDISLVAHKALFKEVSYSASYSEWYTGGGEFALVDGKVGSLDFKDGNWQGFWGDNVIITIDLKEVTEVLEADVGFYQYNNSWIFIPKAVFIETSTDGIVWEKDNFHAIEIQDVQKERGKFTMRYLVKTKKPVSARFIKVKVENIGKVPDWHEAAGSDAWIFMDEIIIR